MYQSALDAFIPFSAPLEGTVTWMYQDNRGLVPTGMGNLIDDGKTPPQEMYSWDWVHEETNQAADHTEIFAAWFKVKQDKILNNKLGGFQYKTLTDIRLTPKSYNQIIQDKLASNIGYLESFFPNVSSWPADAQLGLLAMSWGLGAEFSPKYPHFTEAANDQDFVGAAAQCSWTNINMDRDRGQRVLFLLAAKAIALGTDTSQLLWPGWQEIDESKTPEQIVEAICSSLV